MNCWKCGANIPDGLTECASCEGPEFRVSGVKYREIDWSKVNNWQTLKRVLAALHIHFQVGTPVERELDDLLKPPR